MSNYYWIVPKDQRHNNWLLHRDHPETGRSLRKRYSDMVCGRCKKLNELDALERGLESDVTLRARSDLVQTSDGFLCGNNKAKDLIESLGAETVRFVSLSASDKYYVLIPDTFAPVDLEAAGMEFLRPCDQCGRFRETCGLPVSSAITFPESGVALVCPGVRLENTLGRVFWFAVHEEMKRALQQNRLTGIEFLRVS